MNVNDTSGRLAELPWHFVLFKEFRFAIKCLMSHSSYDFLATDSVSMWRETLNDEAIIARNNKLNPTIETSPSRLLHHLEELIGKNDKENTLDVMLCSQDKLTIGSHSSLSGYSFRWEFHLAPADKVVFAEQLTKPLIVMVAELSRRQQEMIKILESKDAQIDDYKAEGVKLSRRYKDDQPFDKLKFSLEMAQSKEFADVVKSPEEVAFSETTKKLYSQIAKQMFKTSCHSVNKKNESSSSNSLANTQLQVGKDYPAGSSKVAPGTDTLRIPVSEKDLELERRKKLKLKLEEEKVRKEVQKKKKRLNL